MEDYNPQKDPLTIVDINREIKMNFRSFCTIEIPLQIIMIICAGVLYYMSFKSEPLFYFIFTITTCLSFAVLCYILSSAIHWGRTLHAMKKGKLHIDTDVAGPRNHLIEILQDTEFQRLKFKKYGTYYLRKFEAFNRFKKKHTMNFFQTYKTSRPGDEFYIVTYDYKHIVLFYNKKFFEYREPTIEDLFADC